MGMRAVLTYHSLDTSGSPISLSPEAFDRHVAWLASGRVRVLSLAEVLAAPDDGGDAVALTFDDGFATFATLAWPRLSSHGLPATVFIVSGHVGGHNDWGGRQVTGIPHLPLMDWDAVARCAESGATIGAHTRTHPSLPTLSTAQVDDELAGCRDDLRAALGLAPATFAYPYGDLTHAVADRARTTYALSCTIVHRILAADEDHALVPRLDAYYFERPGALDGWGTSTFRARLTGRHMLRRARAAARRLGSVR